MSRIQSRLARLETASKQVTKPPMPCSVTWCKVGVGYAHTGEVPYPCPVCGRQPWRVFGLAEGQTPQQFWDAI